MPPAFGMSSPWICASSIEDETASGCALPAVSMSADDGGEVLLLGVRRQVAAAAPAYYYDLLADQNNQNLAPQLFSLPYIR